MERHVGWVRSVSVLDFGLSEPGKEGLLHTRTHPVFVFVIL